MPKNGQTDQFTAEESYNEAGLQTENIVSPPPGPEQPQEKRQQPDFKRRQVTDPVTHLPITIHDTTDTELEHIPSPPASPQQQPPEDESKRKANPDTRHEGMNDLIEEEMKGRWVNYVERERRGRIRATVVAGAAGMAGTLMAFLWGKGGVGFEVIELVIGVIGCAMLGLGIAVTVRVFTGNDDEVSSRGVVDEQHKNEPTLRDLKPPESAAWLNSFLSSLWPIVNPALFAALTDMLEDVMQASMPKFIHGIRVTDFGQGNESMRILGIRWLEAGDAAQTKPGMQGEEGDFVNLEIAVAYRSRPTGATGGGLRKRSRNAHILIEFWSLGGLKLPVWMEVTGILATARVRVQLTPNPPFLSLATITLLGQPKVNVSCVPIAKSFLNIMDLPVVSRFLQKSIDEAVAMYVVPRSLTLDLKTLLTGQEKLDTESTGVIVVRVISAHGFKDGDGGKKWLSDEKKRGDPYVSVGWGKWGKGIWTTRVIENEGEPVWDETNVVLVGPPDVNAGENLRLQLWDSDRTTADDLLGVVEIPLSDIMSQRATKNCLSLREDGFSDHEGKHCPGTLQWEIGYFEKTNVDDYLSEHKREETKQTIEKGAEEKLREAQGADENGDVHQQKREDLKERTDEFIAGSPPNQDWPSGILHIQIEQIMGLEVENVRKSGDVEDEEGDLPSAYCTVILNHEKVYKTRTKLKDNKPFFEAGTERFIRDFRTTSLIIAVRDHRSNESDPLLGVVILPLLQLFSNRSQLTQCFPLVGGIGCGRLRLSLIFRSLQLHLPPELTGWNIGTLEIAPVATSANGLPQDLSTCRLVLRTLYAKRKLFPDPSSPGTWTRKRRERSLRLTVCKRYASCLLIKFRKYSIGPDTTPAFCTLWFKDLPDSKDTEITLPIFRDGSMKRAVHNAVLDAGKAVGELRLRVQMWPGLSGYHQALASSDENMADVMEVLEAAEDAKEIDYASSASSCSSSSSSSDDSDSDYGKEVDVDDDDGRRGFKDELRDFKKNRKDMHRRHRGLMQWRAMRKLAWVGRGIKEHGHELGEEMKGKWKHHAGSGRSDGVETEV